MKRYIQNSIVGFLNREKLPVEETIANLRLSTMFMDSIIFLTRGENISRINRNKKKNTIIISELKKLQRAFENAGVDFVTFKGITLANELYPQTPEIRGFGDIDILVKEKDLQVVSDFFSDLGYTYADGKKISEDVIHTDFNYIMGEHHLLPYYKTIVDDEGELYSIIFEVHYKLFQKSGNDFGGEKDNYSYDSFISSKEEVTICNVSINILSLNDRFLYLVSHCGGHIIIDVREQIYEENLNRSSIYVKGLFDVAMFYLLHKDELDIQYLIHKAKEYDVYHYFCMYIHVINTVFPGLLCPELSICADEPFDGDDRIVAVLYRAIKNISLSDLIKGNYHTNIIRGIEQCMEYLEVYVLQRKQRCENVYLQRYSDFCFEPFTTMNIEYDNDFLKIVIAGKKYAVCNELKTRSLDDLQGFSISFYAKEGGIIRNRFNYRVFLTFDQSNQEYVLVDTKQAFDCGIEKTQISKDKYLLSIRDDGDIEMVFLPCFFDSNEFYPSNLGFEVEFTRLGQATLCNGPFTHRLIEFR